MPGKQVNELDVLPSFTDTSLLPVHNGTGLKKGLLSQLANYLGNKFSNPNLLINPDFKINQRGSSTYTTTSESPIYTVDRWMLSRGKATVNSDGTVTITATGGTTNKEGYFQQKLENAISGAYTVSMEVVRISGTVRIAIDGEWKTVTSGKNVFQGVNSSNNFDSVGLQLAVGASITLKYMKLEQGSVATSFVAPNPADELIKCQRFYFKRYYYYAFYSGTANFTYIFSDTIPDMRIKPTVNFANTSNAGLTRAVVQLDTTAKDLTLLIQAVTSKVMMNDEYKVYVSLQDGYITSINSEIFLSQEEIQTMTEIDKGKGDKYAHAQSQYLEKGLVDEQGRYNYKFVEGRVIEVAEEDKPKVVDPEQQATAQDKIEAQIMYTALMTDTLLGESEA